MITYYDCNQHLAKRPQSEFGREQLTHMLLIHCDTTPGIVLPRKHPQQRQQFDPRFVEWMTQRGWWDHAHVDCGGNRINPLEQLVQYAAYVMVFVPTAADAAMFKLRWS